MANQKHLDLLRQGKEVWNQWRKEQPKIALDLSRADLRGLDLRDYHIGDVLVGADFRWAKLSGTNLTGVYLSWVDFSASELVGADLSNTFLDAVNFRWTKLSGVNFRNARLNLTAFASVDLHHVKGLETVQHSGPSIIDIDTIYRSGGKIPEIFLRGIGVPDIWITYIHSLLGQPIDYYYNGGEKLDRSMR